MKSKNKTKKDEEKVLLSGVALKFENGQQLTGEQLDKLKYIADMGQAGGKELGYAYLDFCFNNKLSADEIKMKIFSLLNLIKNPGISPMSAEQLEYFIKFLKMGWEDVAIPYFDFCINDLMKKMEKEFFPNGEKDIEEGTNELLRILNHRIDEKTARSILLKSSSICYTTSLNDEFSIIRLKEHLAPYALHYFDNQALNDFYAHLLSKNRRAYLFNAAKEFSKISNPDGTDKEEMPESYGEFGLEITNPIPTSSIPQNIFYLDRLRTIDNIAITYDRIGSTRAQNIQLPIDVYEIFVNGKHTTKLYICPYNKKTSTKAPKGFKLV